MASIGGGYWESTIGQARWQEVRIGSFPDSAMANVPRRQFAHPMNEWVENLQAKRIKLGWYGEDGCLCGVWKLRGEEDRSSSSWKKEMIIIIKGKKRTSKKTELSDSLPMTMDRKKHG